MSEIARKVLAEARTEREARNDARRIRYRVDAAKQSPVMAGVRWPFELMQNAHDAGPRNNDGQVEVSFSLDGDELTVAHTGKAFTGDELAALLSGGSSKEFDDVETTGRFGTGFLVTHAVSTLVNIESVLDTPEGPYVFRIELARDGDENSIIENIKHADYSMSNAKAVPSNWLDSNPTAKFIYRGADCDVVHRGLDRLHMALPYLYATCAKLGRVRIERYGTSTVFEPGNITQFELDGFLVKEAAVSISGGVEPKQLSAICIGPEDDRSSLLVLVEHCGDQKNLVQPERAFPKLFVTFPIAATGFLPFHVVLDGQFTPQQERDGILMNDNDKDLIISGMSALPTLVQYAVESDWVGAHNLAYLAAPERTFSDESDSGELDWWQRTVSKIAGEIAARPIIETSAGLLPAVPGPDTEAVSFLVASVDARTADCIDYDVIYNLASPVKALHIPTRNVARDWDDIARQWEGINVPVTRLGFEELTELVKTSCDTADSLPVDQDPFTWLADLFFVGAELSQEYAIESTANGLMPDQMSMLRNAKALHLDNHISDEVKDIGECIGLDLRSELLHNNLVTALDEPGYESARSFVIGLLSGQYNETDAVDNILEAFDVDMPDDAPFVQDVHETQLRAAVRLVTYLSEKEDDQRLRRCPLLTAANTFSYLTGNQQILAPVAHWPERAQMYEDLYTRSRVLSTEYCRDDNLKPALEPLIRARLAIPAPLYQSHRGELEPNLLNAMAADPNGVTGVSVRNESFSQIAFLSTELVNRAGHDPDTAKLLMDFILDVAAREDQSWSEVRRVNAHRAGEQIELFLPGATWPFELKVRSWIPVPLSEESDETGYAQVPANADNLQRLYEPSLLRNNAGALALLDSVFGFNKLTLMLASLEPQVEEDLVVLLEDPNLVQSVAANPEAAHLIANASTEQLQQVSAQLLEQNREAELRERNRRFGISAQEALAGVMRHHGLDLKLIDAGFDYEVTPGSLDGQLDDAYWRFEVEKYLLEVKATTTGDVRLTPLQAQTASTKQDQFILCVIDLRGQEPKQDWDPSEISTNAMIVTDMGTFVNRVFNEIVELSDSDNEIRLRNEQMLRYGLSISLWDSGISIDEWVQSLRSG